MEVVVGEAAMDAETLRAVLSTRGTVIGFEPVDESEEAELLKEWEDPSEETLTAMERKLEMAKSAVEEWARRRKVKVEQRDSRWDEDALEIDLVSDDEGVCDGLTEAGSCERNEGEETGGKGSAVAGEGSEKALSDERCEGGVRGDKEGAVAEGESESEGRGRKRRQVLTEDDFESEMVEARALARQLAKDSGAVEAKLLRRKLRKMDKVWQKAMESHRALAGMALEKEAGPVQGGCVIWSPEGIVRVGAGGGD